MGKWDWMKPENVAKLQKTKKYKELQKRNIKEYYQLTSKILKLGALPAKNSAHLVMMFSDAAFNCNPKSKDVDAMFAKLLDLSIKHSKK